MVYGLLALLVVLLDQATKYYVVTHFALGESVPVINNVFHWTFILNRGAAFGMLEGSRWLFVMIAVAVIGGVWFMRREIAKSGVMACWGTALFAGGALGNLIALLGLSGVVVAETKLYFEHWEKVHSRRKQLAEIREDLATENN